MTPLQIEEINRKQLEMLKEMIAVKKQERSELREKLLASLRQAKASKLIAEAEIVKELGHDY